MVVPRIAMTKHHGLGNDFVIAELDAVKSAFGLVGEIGASGVDATAELAAFARRVCDRTQGIGADGLMLISSHPTATARMILFNADGTRAEISGNGIRCFAQAIAMRDSSLAPQTIETDAGLRQVELMATPDPSTVMARVLMGQVNPTSAPAKWGNIGVNPDRPVAHLSLGNPHTVVGVDNVDEVDLSSLGELVPEVNLEIIEPTAEVDLIRMRVHERGVGITQACGTGACAAAVAAVRWGLVPASTTAVRVQMDGGIATVEVNTPGPGDVTLTGPATFVEALEYQL
jgi:diaminopimelate epimerase